MPFDIERWTAEVRPLEPQIERWTRLLQKKSTIKCQKNQKDTQLDIILQQWSFIRTILVLSWKMIRKLIAIQYIIICQ